MELTTHLLFRHWREPGQDAPIALFGQLKRIVRQWLDECLECKGGTYPAQLILSPTGRLGLPEDHPRHRQVNELKKGRTGQGRPTRSTDRQHCACALQQSARRTLGNPRRGQPAEEPRQLGHSGQRLGKRILPESPSRTNVLAYTKNHNLGLEVPYRFGSAIASTSRTSSCKWTTVAARTTH